MAHSYLVKINLIQFWTIWFHTLAAEDGVPPKPVLRLPEHTARIDGTPWCFILHNIFKNYFNSILKNDFKLSVVSLSMPPAHKIFFKQRLIKSYFLREFSLTHEKCRKKGVCV